MNQTEATTPPTIDDADLNAYIEEQQTVLDGLKKGKRLYLTMTLVIVAIAAVVAIAANLLAGTGAITVLVQGRLMFISVLVLFIAAIIYFSGVRPVKRKVKAAEERLETLSQHFEESPVPDEDDVMQDDGVSQATAVVAAVQTETADSTMDTPEEGESVGAVDNLAKNSVSENLNDFFKIFERGVRNPLVPDTPEYHRLRGVFRSLVAVSIVLMVASLVLYALMPSSVLFASLILILGYAVLIGAFVLDRKQLKPMRNEWARRLHTTEFESRHGMFHHEGLRGEDEGEKQLP